MDAGTPVRRKPITSIERTRKLSILLRHQRHATVRDIFLNLKLFCCLGVDQKVRFFCKTCRLSLLKNHYHWGAFTTPYFNNKGERRN